MGRLLSVDPHAQIYSVLSPYCYAADNPLAIIDPTGMDTVGSQNQNSGKHLSKPESGSSDKYAPNPSPNGSGDCNKSGSFVQKGIDAAKLVVATSRAVKLANGVISNIPKASNVAEGLSATGKLLGPVTVGAAIYVNVEEYNQGSISKSRLNFNLGSIVTSLTVTSAIGGPVGGAAGAATGVALQVIGDAIDGAATLLTQIDQKIRSFDPDKF